MKKLIVLALTLICILGISGCGSSESYTIEFTIPAGSTEAFVYAEEEISSRRDSLKISAGAGIAATEVVLKTVEGKAENAYEPVTLTQKKPVKIDVEKGAWFRIGVAVQNPAEVPIAVSIRVEDVDVRIG